MHKLTCDFVVHPGLCAANVLKVDLSFVEERNDIYIAQLL